MTFSVPLVPRCPHVPLKCCSNSVAIRKALTSGLASQTGELCLSCLKPGGSCCQRWVKRELGAQLFTTRWRGPSSFAGRGHIAGDLLSTHPSVHPVRSITFAVPVFSDPGGNPGGSWLGGTGTSPCRECLPAICLHVSCQESYELCVESCAWGNCMLFCSRGSLDNFFCQRK